MKDAKQILQEMRDTIGKQDPIMYFEKLTDFFETLFVELENIKNKVDNLSVQSSLAIKWDAKLAGQLLIEEIDRMRQNKETFVEEIHACKEAYNKGDVTKDYDTFVTFWVNTLGYHPFMDRI